MTKGYFSTIVILIAAVLLSACSSTEEIYVGRPLQPGAKNATLQIKDKHGVIRLQFESGHDQLIEGVIEKAGSTIPDSFVLISNNPALLKGRLEFQWHMEVKSWVCVDCQFQTKLPHPPMAWYLN